MQMDDSRTPVKKLERLLVLYYDVFRESTDDGLYDEWKDSLFEGKFKVSKYTARRYINELIKTGRVIMEEIDEWSYTLHNKTFISLEEINDYIRIQEEKWCEKGSLTGEGRRLIHLIRLIGWLDLFLKNGMISEVEIKRFYSNKSAKRTVQRDFAFLRRIKIVPLYINRQKVISKENGLIQWFYVADEKKRHRAEMTL
ncbi:MAG: hypothetical protein K0S47_3799 [Herbinix sp.]|jgi:hypothetical protein|nr:hypothetical protein [Herbinix sp.]